MKLYRFEKFINEGLSDVLYHYTFIDTLIEIVKTDTFRTSPAISGVENEITPNHLFFISTARSKATSYAPIGNNFDGLFVRFTLDGRKIKNNLKGKPVTFLLGTDEDTDVDSRLSEMEDRIMTDKALIHNFGKYVSGVDILLNPYIVKETPAATEESFRNLLENLEIIEKWSEKYNISVRFFYNKKDYLVGKGKFDTDFQDIKDDFIEYIESPKASEQFFKYNKSDLSNLFIASLTFRNGKVFPPDEEKVFKILNVEKESELFYDIKEEQEAIETSTTKEDIDAISHEIFMGFRDYVRHKETKDNKLIDFFKWKLKSSKIPMNIDDYTSKMVFVNESKSYGEMDSFFERNNIDRDELYYLGSGDFGEAYTIDGDRVLKVTTSKNEFEIAKKLKDNPLSHIAKVYDVAKIEENDFRGKYFIIVENLEQDSDIENFYYSIDEYTPDGVMGIPYIDDEEIEDDNLKKFINDLYVILLQCNELGVFVPDISPDNLGYDKNGTLKAFDVQDKSN